MGGERVQGNLGLLSPVDLDRGKLRKERLDGHEKATPCLRGTYAEAQNREGRSHIHLGGGEFRHLALGLELGSNLASAE